MLLQAHCKAGLGPHFRLLPKKKKKKTSKIAAHIISIRLKKLDLSLQNRNRLTVLDNECLSLQGKNAGKK